MIRNLLELARELLNAAAVALDPGELHDTPRRPAARPEPAEPILWCTPYCDGPCSAACETGARAVAAL